jgi:acyl-ACP thioesterase
MSKFEKVGIFQFMTESYLLDFRGRLTIPMIGNYLLHAASDHASQRGFGFSEMTEKQTAWVLSRLAIEINRYPEMSESITLYTWIDEVSRLFTSRCFELTDRAGIPVVFARSVWAAIDMQTRRPTPLDVEALSVYISERSCPVERPGKIAAVENEASGVPYQVKYSDLDINGHFNSIKYMEHLLDLFELDLFKEKEVRRFEIAYLSEGRYGMPLTLHKKEMKPDTYNMAIRHEGKDICRAMANWMMQSSI